MICQKKAIGKFFATVVSQDGMKSMRPGLWNMSVAQKLMMGHIKGCSTKTSSYA